MEKHWDSIKIRYGILFVSAFVILGIGIWSGVQSGIQMRSPENSGEMAEKTPSPTKRTEIAEIDCKSVASNENISQKTREQWPVVVIDAGHGGTDTGTYSKDQKYLEKDIALKVVYIIREIMEKEEVNIFFTRLEDKTLSKNERVNMAKRVNADLFVSVHCNASEKEDGLVRGMETLYSGYSRTEKNKITSKLLAKNILTEMCNSTGRSKRKIFQRNGLFLMKYSQMPVAIAEIGYMTDDSDLEYMIQPENQDKIAIGICNGIKKTLEEMER